MTVVAYPLGFPRPAASRGGDCRAHDLSQDRDVLGLHRFASSAHCQINNGLLRVSVGAPGAVPTLTIEARRGRTTIGDVFEDVFHDTFGGSVSTPEWIAMGTLTIDSPSVAALLSAVRIMQVTAEAITIRLVAPLVADAFVTLNRGERMVHIQHGSTRSPLVATARRVRWTDSPSPVGTGAVGRVQEDFATHQGFPRWVGAIDPVTVNAGAFSLSTASVTTARFGVGVGTYNTADSPGASHAQLGDSSLPSLVVT